MIRFPQENKKGASEEASRKGVVSAPKDTSQVERLPGIVHLSGRQSTQRKTIRKRREGGREGGKQPSFRCFRASPNVS